jgi:acyl-coenzyme A thioesterase PaaI-like protein
MEKEVIRYSGCFVCGLDNEIGLKLNFHSDGEKAHSQWLPAKRHEGYQGIVHGGLLATVLDEVMIKAVLALDIRCVTASMEVKFRAPADVGDLLELEGRVTERKGRIIFTTGSIRNSRGVVVAEATAKYMTVPRDLDQRLKASTD